MRTHSSHNIRYGHINTFTQTQATVLLSSAEGGPYNLLCPDLYILTTCRLLICMTLFIGMAMLKKHFASLFYHMLNVYIGRF
jgi:hypothetical protein